MHYAVAFSVQSLEFAPRQGQFLLETAMYDVRYAGMTEAVSVGKGEERNDGRTEKATSRVASYELFLLNDDTSLMK